MTSTIQSGASLVGRVGGSIVGQLRSAIRPTVDRPGSGWLVVTVLRDLADVDPTTLPEPLTEFGERIELRVQPAPAGKGTELAARLRDESDGTAASRLSGNDPQAYLRSALRRSKQLLEVGEVLVLDPVPHGERTATPGGALLEAWTRAASRAGVR